jgi:hypothetical protein
MVTNRPFLYWHSLMRPSLNNGDRLAEEVRDLLPALQRFGLGLKALLGALGHIHEMRSGGERRFLSWESYAGRNTPHLALPEITT